jgi:hypothetical protein
MKHSRYLILCVLVQFSSVLSQDSASSRLDWNKLSIAWQGFLSNPTKTNGTKVCLLLPSKHYGITEPDSVYHKSWDSLYENLYKLEALVISQRRIAVKVAFSLFPISDAAFTETLDQMLGKLIQINPRMFLEELSSHRNLVGALGGLLGNLGEEFVDNIEAQNSEIKLRIRALKSVKIKMLSSVRDECIAELQTQIR